MHDYLKELDEMTSVEMLARAIRELADKCKDLDELKAALDKILGDK